MHLKWKKEVLVSSFAVFMTATSLNAIPRGPCEPPPPPICCEEPKPGPFAFAYPYDMNLACPRDFYFHVDGLAMQLKEDGMAWAIEDSITPSTSNAITGGSVVGWTNDHRDWEYNWGVRVGAGFYLDHDAWNLDFDWTWVNISDYKKRSASTSGGVLIPLWAVGNGAGNVDAPVNLLSGSLSSVWDGDYNTVDLKLAKPYHVSRYLVLSPHFGVRGGWITQHFSVDYSGASSANRFVHHGKNDFWGVGARSGLNSSWIFGKGFNLFGNFAASLLYGKFDIEQRLTTPGTNIGFTIEDDHFMNVPNMEMEIGFTWGHYFDCNRYHVSLSAAYEFHYWWDQLNLRKFYGAGPFYPNDVVSRGDLSLSGFSLSLQFDM